MALYANGFEMMREVAHHASFTKAKIALGVSGYVMCGNVAPLSKK